MSDRMIDLPERCPVCRCDLQNGEPHGWDCQYVSNAEVDRAVRHILGGGINYAKVRPSLGDACPRKGCGLNMKRFERDGLMYYACPGGHYECVERSAS